MSLNSKLDLEIAKNISHIYSNINANTKFTIIPRTEEDIKKKIWRFKVVKRDENALKISTILKTEKQSKNVQASKKPNQTVLKCPIKKNKPSQNFRHNTIISKVWKMHNDGQTLDQIATKLNISKRKIYNSISIRRKQYNISVPKKTNSNKGIYKSGTKTDLCWKLYEQGYSKEEIAIKMNITKQKVATFISNRKKQLNIQPKESEVTKMVWKLKNEGKLPKTISRQLNISYDSVKYHFYKKKLPNVYPTENEQCEN